MMKNWILEKIIKKYLLPMIPEWLKKPLRGALKEGNKRVNKDTYTESENEEKEMKKKYSGRGNQDADLFK